MIKALPQKGCWGFYAHSPVEVPDIHRLLCNLAQRTGTFSMNEDRPEVLEWRDAANDFQLFNCDYEFESVLQAAVALNEYRNLKAMEALP